MTRGMRSLLTSIGFLLSGFCAFGAPVEDSEIRVILNSDIRSTHIGVNRDGNTDTVMHHLVEGLVALREDMTVGPDLAKSVAVSDDGITYQFELHSDLKFHNGSPVTSTEVRWSLERIIKPEFRHRCAGLFNGATPLSASISEISTPTPSSIVVRLERPAPLFLTLMANVQCTAGIIHPDSYDEDGNWISPIGTGPYKLNRWQRGSFILLERNDDYIPRGEKRDGYTGAKIALSKYLRFVVVADPGVAVEAVRNGEIDLLPIMPPALVDWSIENSASVEHQGRSLLSWNVLLMQPDDPVVKNPKVRAAIASAIDIDEVAAFATYGRAMGNFSAMSPETPNYTEFHQRKPAYDLSRARRLLQESGYSGERIVIQTNRRFSTMYDNAVVIHTMLSEVGFNADIEVLDYATQLSNFFSGDFQLSSFGYSGRAHGALRFANFVGPRSSNPRFQWDGEKPFSLVGTALNATTDEELIAALENLHEAMIEDLPLIGLFNDYGVSMNSTRISDFRPWSMGRPRLWGVRINQSAEKDSPEAGQ